jgi:hypothetical protein
MLAVVIGGAWAVNGLLGAGLVLIYAGLVVVPATRPVATGGLLGTDARSELLVRGLVTVLMIVSVGSTIFEKPANSEFSVRDFSAPSLDS